MKYTVVLIALLALLIACGSSTGPDEPELTPSVLSLEFTGDSSKVCGYAITQSTEPILGGSTGVSGSPGLKGSCEVTATWTICPDIAFNCYLLYRSETPGIQSDPSSAEILGTFSDPNITEYVDSDIDMGNELLLYTKDNRRS